MITKVQDSGIGIHKDEAKKLFNFFGKLEKSKNINKGGMGFGLTISKMIAELLNGNICMETEYGKRTSFNFQI